MYHSIYPTSWLFGSNVGTNKFPYFMTYNDLPVITLDPISQFSPYGQFQSIYGSPIVLDLSTMKRIPMNLLMRNMESFNCSIPLWQRKDLSNSWTHLERLFSKESISDSGNCSDSGISSSRSSTPNSVGTGSINSPRASTPKEKTSGRKHRKTSESDQNQYGRLNKQKYTPVHQRHSSVGARYDIPQSLPESPWNKISQDIWKHYLKNRQPEEMFHKKMRLHHAVLNILSQIFPNCGLRVVGSSVNGLGANTSDMDMCLIVTSTEIDQQNEALMFLTCAQNCLKRCSFVKSTELITAKVPILKFVDKYDIQVDLNVNNTVGIANTYLIRCYCYLDWRVQPLVLIIKKWAQDCDINNAKDMTLSSYSLTLMVLHFLQCGCYPPVLPCLQKVRPDSHDTLPDYQSRNVESLGELLFGFFDYFTNKFDFDRDVMSVRLGSKLPKHIAMNYRSAKNKRGHWRYICIEEPFNRTNTACAVYDKDSFARIYSAFHAVWLNLQKHKDISSVLNL